MSTCLDQPTMHRRCITGTRPTFNRASACLGHRTSFRIPVECLRERRPVSTSRRLRDEWRLLRPGAGNVLRRAEHAWLRLVLHDWSEYLRCWLFALPRSLLAILRTLWSCPGGVNLGPLFTSTNQAIRGVLPAPPVVQSISFPQQQPADNSLRIESSLDQNLVTPKSYSWSATFERQWPRIRCSRSAIWGVRDVILLAQRDVMQPINLVDPNFQNGLVHSRNHARETESTRCSRQVRSQLFRTLRTCSREQLVTLDTIRH